MRHQPAFLPLTISEKKTLRIDQFDIILVTGDAYVDHPSFGTSLIGRVLWDAGYSVGIVAQPDSKTDIDFTRLGKPRLYFGISSGNVDSMVDNYTPAKKRRSSDVYSAGGVLKRPDRATIVYTNRVHQLYPDVPIVIGGIEASLRRFAHYDYWSDKVRQSILADAPATLLAYGMAERQMVEIARRLDNGEPAQTIRDVAGTCYKMEVAEWRKERQRSVIEIPSFSEVLQDSVAYARAFATHYSEQDPIQGQAVGQPHPKTVIVQNPPSLPISTSELDHIYELPFSRRSHPSYKEPVPALLPVQFSIVSHRGCFGSCSFCSLTHHQGRIIQSRSIESVIREVTKITKMPEFKGVIQDVGGPTANMFGMGCNRGITSGACKDKRCLPECKSLKIDHQHFNELLEKIRNVPGVKKVFVSSGIRYDLILIDENGPQFLEDLCTYHVSGHLKVAPEHISTQVTHIMNKPDGSEFDRFFHWFSEIQKGKSRRQYLVPYFMSGHPGCTIKDMIDLAEFIRDRQLYTEQVQDFTPTPMSVSSCMYHTKLNPFTLQPVYVPQDKEKKIQRALMQYKDTNNYDLVLEGLRNADRLDLVGTKKMCLIPEKKHKK